MGLAAWWAVLLVGVLSISEVSASCPWNRTDLQNWSNSSSWPGNTLPQENQQVVIAGNMKILLDVEPPTLATLTIEAGAVLVWDDKDNLTLSTHYILVQGELHIGSTTCRFKKNARIRLLGKSDTPFNVTGFGHKFIGVTENGTLELHGKRKTSWTKLVQTVRPMEDESCGLVYQHSEDKENSVANVRNVGLHVIVWNQDGSLIDFGAFKATAFTGFSEFFNTIDNGKVIGIFTFDLKDNLTQSVKDTIISMGGSMISEVEAMDSYSFLTKKGSSSSTQEFTKKNGITDFAEPGYLSLLIGDLVFQVSKSSAERKNYFRVAHQDWVYPILTLKDNITGWSEGDEILVTSTDFDWQQGEIRSIVKCSDCTSRQIRVNASFEFMHFGNFTYGIDERAEVAMLTRTIKIEGVMEAECYTSFDSDFDRKLCRTFGRDTFGAHVKVLKGHTSVRVRGVQLTNMGQQRQIGTYPLHCHLCDDVSGTYFNENTIRDSNSRCFTIHGTNKLKVMDNVCWKHLGHGMFLEDAVEQNNKIIGNLIGGGQFGARLLSDMSNDMCEIFGYSNLTAHCEELSEFWLTHPNNEIKGNVAAGGQGHGYMYVFADLPLGPSRNRDHPPHHPKDTPLFFEDNVAHSQAKSGMFMDSKISTGTGMEERGNAENVPQNGILQTENEYHPHVDGKPVWVNMTRTTFYKNMPFNLWVKGGNVRLEYSSIADSKIGFGGGTTLKDTGSMLYRCIFIGESENTGLARTRNIGSAVTGKNSSVPVSFERNYGASPAASLTGVEFFQGPIYVIDTFFDKFETQRFCLYKEDAGNCDDSASFTRYSGAISFKRTNTYPSMTSSYVQNNRFGFCDNENGTKHHVFQGRDGDFDWYWRDGNLGIFFRDKDGQVTGTVNSSVVLDRPFYDRPKCLKRPDWGDLLVCPYRYIKMEMLGSGGNLDRPRRVYYPMMMKRDDAPYNETFGLMGEIRNEYLLTTHRSYMLDYNGTAYGNQTPGFPKINIVNGYGVEKQDVVRMGVCQPLGLDKTDYGILVKYPVAADRNNVTWVNSLSELDAFNNQSAFPLFLDTTRGILFFKIWSRHSDTNDTQQCPEGNCFYFRFIINSEYNTTIRSCFHYNITAYSHTTVTPAPSKPTIPACVSEENRKPATGWGAVDWSQEQATLVHTEYTVPCTPFEEPSGLNVEHKGCYKIKKDADTLLGDITDTEKLGHNSMTRDLCVTRCYYRGYKYAGLNRGQWCTCGNDDLNEELRVTDATEIATKCNKNCKGNSDETCGGLKHMDILSTGN